MENQFRNYIKKASQIKDNLCIWKYISNETTGKMEGRMKRCDDECDGINTNCEYYIDNTRSVRR